MKSGPSGSGIVGVTVPVAPGVVKVGRAARLPSGTARTRIEEVRRLLLAEDAMLSVAAWARTQLQLAGHSTDRRVRLVDAAGLATTFWRPFVKDDEGERLDPVAWRARIANDPDQAAMWDRLQIRRNKVLAHSDTRAGMVNVTNTYRIFEKSQPGDPLDLRVYDVGADDGLLDPPSLLVIAELAERLADLLSDDMVKLGATRVHSLGP